MSATEVIAIEDDEDDEIEVVSVDKQPVSKVEQIRLQIDLLQAFCKSSEPVPLEYNKFYKCAKKVRSNISDAIILAAWKRAISKQLNNMIRAGKTNTRSHIREPSTIPLVVDLTESNIDYRSPTSSVQPTPFSSESHIVTEIDPISQSLAVPVALVANPNYYQNNTDSTELVISSTETTNDPILDIDVDLVNKLEDVTHCLVKIVNDSLDYPEDSDICSISEHEETDLNNVPTEIVNSPILYDESNLNISTNVHSEDSSLCDSFDLQSLNDGRDESNESDASNQSIKMNRQKKRKSKDMDDIFFDTPSMNKVSPRVSSSFLGAPAKISKLDNSQRKIRKSKKTKSMTESELKLFREEQKRQKLREKRDLMSKQLERVHDRLVDVLIPKFFNCPSKNK